MSEPSNIEKHEVVVTTPDAQLAGDLQIPDGSEGLVLFAHGSGSSRKSPRNRFVADELNMGGLATLLFDLLTPEENRVDQRTAELRFDIDLLARRLSDAVTWTGEQKMLASLPIGLFGASTGAAAALNVAAEQPDRIAAVVSRGGRPDLAERALPQVSAPTLLIVGGLDEQVLQLNRTAAERMTGETKIEVVSGATHLFEEPGKLEEVARLARDWFQERLSI